MTLKCGNCGKTFDTPFTLNEDEGDEDAEVCPYCESDNFTETQKSNENSNNVHGAENTDTR